MSDKLKIPESGPMNEEEAQDARHWIAKLQMQLERALDAHILWQVEAEKRQKRIEQLVETSYG